MPARQPCRRGAAVSASAYAGVALPPMRGRRSGAYRRGMSSATEPLPPARRVGEVGALRRGAAWLHLALALAVALGVFLQVYLIGAYIFGAGSDALNAHESVGFAVHGLEVLLFVVALVAWLPRADIGLSLLMTLLGTTQIALAGAHGWTGGLHPLGALLVLVLAAAIVRRDRRR
jgi:hypothetical protein